MYAQVLTGHGGPDKYEFKTGLAVPKCGPNDVLIRVSACGCNNTDIWTREGAYSSDKDESKGWDEPLKFPRIQGCDIVGSVAAVGTRVDPKRVGERVLVNPTLHGPNGETDCRFVGSELDGGFASHCVVPAVNAHRVPRDCKLSDTELATFPCSYQTAWHMLRRSRLGRGEVAIVTGASGGVGTALVQLCKIVGARVVAVTSASKAAAVRELGADATVDRLAKDFDALLASAIGACRQAEAKAQRTGGPSHQADVALDNVAGPMLMNIINSLRPNGRYATAGSIAGQFPKLHWPTFYLKQLDLLGCVLATRGEFDEVRNMIFEGKIKPLVARVFPLRHLANAQAFFKKKKFVGNVVVDCSSGEVSGG